MTVQRSHLYIRTDPVLHQYLANLSVPSQRSPVQSGVTIHVHQLHLCRTFMNNIYVSTTLV